MTVEGLMATLGSVLQGRFEWYYDFSGIKDLLHPSWRTWMRFRLRRTEEQYDFLHMGLFLNAPQMEDKRLFTGTIVGLFKHDWHIGRWRPLSHYNLRPLPQPRSA